MSINVRSAATRLALVSLLAVFPGIVASQQPDSTRRDTVTTRRDTVTAPHDTAAMRHDAATSWLPAVRVTAGRMTTPEAASAVVGSPADTRGSIEPGSRRTVGKRGSACERASAVRTGGAVGRARQRSDRYELAAQLQTMRRQFQSDGRRPGMVRRVCAGRHQGGAQQRLRLLCLDRRPERRGEPDQDDT